MNRSSHKKHGSSSFNKFVARLQRTFSSTNTKSSTIVIQQQQHHTHSSTFSNRFQLSDILYNPSRPIEYLSEIKNQNDNSYSFSSYNSINTQHEDEFNLSQMNISMNNNYDHCLQQKFIKLPIRLHSTAIHDISNC